MKGCLLVIDSRIWDMAGELEWNAQYVVKK
jgi:hypothetical protein